MTNLNDIRGLGPKTVNKLNNLGIKTINDLLFLFPRKYIRNEINEFSEKQINKELTLEVEIYHKPKIYFIRKNLDKLSFQVETKDKIIFSVHIFNRRFLFKMLQPGIKIVITGRFIKNFSSFTASNILLKKNYKLGIIPYYGLTDIKEAILKKAITQIFLFDFKLQEVLPEYLLKQQQMPSINELIKKIHYPINEADILLAKKRIIYEELLKFALKIEALKKYNESIITIKKNYDIKIVKDFIKTIPYTLTNDQKKATNEIFADLKSDKQMNRLLQGDVGSGKTIIAVIASLAVVTAKQQVAIMAPTLVLAKQHFKTFQELLAPLQINLALLTSEMKQKDKFIISQQIRDNEIDIIIGTHSLIQESVDFHNLGFIIIDEQHRFGVKQRRLLRQKGALPDILLMSATPIPRTLAISIYKDIDISFIKEKPVGRQEVITDIIEYEDFDLLLEIIKKELDQNHQAYFICPKILETEKTSKFSVEKLTKILEQKLSKYSIASLHGKMLDIEKTEILNDFYANRTDVLISTTVVEVGVNVLNATVMVIMNADSFGLAQLHQLRGRIGRNNLISYCYLVIDQINNSLDRLQILKETNDGFLISEYDLKLRGPGEVFGNIQSGIPLFKMANLISDQKILEQAFKDANQVFNSRDKLSKALMEKAIKSIETYNLD